MTKMPKIDEVDLYGAARGYVRLICKSDGTLRASKPPVVRLDLESGCAAYVWRMVAFQISPKSRHHCMPATADWEIPLDHQERREKVKELDKIVSDIVDAVPVKDWHGVKRWGQAYGVVGEPELAPDGSIIYR